MQAEVNVGLLGHVDHGKTSLAYALSGVWTDTYSEELRRGISIRIGYADVSIFKCPSCHRYSTSKTCPYCHAKTEFVRKISLLDAPGHETLMATAISASSIMDGAILVIAANEPCPQPQTKEHLMVLEAMGIKNIVIVQTKIDLVKKEDAIKNYEQITEFLRSFGYENVPIIPVAAHFKINIDKVLEAIEKHIPTPKRDESLPFKMYVARSFDVNRPGMPIAKLSGGVIGGSIIQGKISVGDEIEIRPGLPKKGSEIETEPIITTVKSLAAGSEQLKTAKPGGLIGVETQIDPYWTKGDRLIGSIVGEPGTLPEVVDYIKVKYVLFDRTDFENKPFTQGEPIVVSIGTATGVGVVAQPGKDTLEIKLKRPMCKDEDSPIAISRRIGQRWRLAGHGRIIG